MRRNGTPGFWVPKDLFVDMEVAFRIRPKLELRIDTLKSRIDSLNRLIGTKTEEAAIAKSQWDYWEDRSETYLDLYLKAKMRSVPPVWRDLLFMAGGGLFVGGAIVLHDAI